MPIRLDVRLLAGAALGAILWVAWWLSIDPVSAEPRESIPLPRPRSVPAWQASTSCASTACHGGPAGTTSRGCEYTFWASRDRHANAYTVLLENRARIIDRNLGGSGKAEKNPLCLRCHTTQGELSEPKKGREQPAVTLLEGVGCDRCHSTRPGGDWIDKHFLRDWPARTEAEKRAAGFRPLGDLVAQARLCAGCHVGTRGADVDHDLIAAGHPRLNFEFSAFRATMPPHWDVRPRKERQPDLEARTWAVGQAVAAEFAFDLLAARAEKDSKKPWPEFAEYDCFACHQPRRASTRKPRDFIPGTLLWGSWYGAALPDALDAYSMKDDGKLVSQLQALQAAMRQPEPDRSVVAKQAAALAASLRMQGRKAAMSESMTAAQAKRRMVGLTARPVTDWDGAAQRYLALAALYHAMTDMESETVDAATAKALRQLKMQLGFAPGRDAPAEFDAESFSRLLQKLHEHLENAETKP